MISVVVVLMLVELRRMIGFAGLALTLFTLLFTFVGWLMMVGIKGGGGVTVCCWGWKWKVGVVC